MRWPVTVTTAVAIGLQLAVPDRLVLVHPSWVLPATQGALLVVLVMANPRRIDNESKALRLAGADVRRPAEPGQPVVAGEARHRHHAGNHRHDAEPTC